MLESTKIHADALRYAAQDALQNDNECNLDEDVLGYFQDQYLANLSDHERKLIEIYEGPTTYSFFYLRTNGSLAYDGAYETRDDLPF